jgi:hypothetical protein
MGWNGSGQFTRDNGTNSGSDVWVQDKGDGTKILASLHDVHDEGIATGLENCITRDGQNSPSGNLPMATYKHTSVGDASAVDQYVTGGQIVNGSVIYGGLATGGSNVYNITIPITPSALATGSVYCFKAHQDSTGSVLVAINGSGTLQKTLKDGTGDLGTGSIKTNDFVWFYYNGTDYIKLDVNGARPKTFSTTLTPVAPMTFSAISYITAFIAKDQRGTHIIFSASFTVGGTPGTQLSFAVPTGLGTDAVNPTLLSCAIWGGSGYHFSTSSILGETITIRKEDGNFTAGALRYVYINATYPNV